MQYEVEIAGRIRQVLVSRSGEGFSVTVDGRTWEVDAARVDACTLSLIVSGRASHEAAVSAVAGSSQMMVRLGTDQVPVVLNNRRRLRSGDDAAHSGGGSQKILAPMPGKVVRVLVGLGDKVRARQPVIVVEAMKMENELRAAREGTVAELPVNEGTSVDAGAVLAVIVPDPA